MRMRNVFVAFGLSLAAVLAAVPAWAGDEKIGLGGDLLLTVPVGNMANSTGLLVGASLRGGYYVLPEFEAYARVGYQTSFGKDMGAVTYRLTDIPILAGGRYFFLQPGAGPYGNLELGLHLLTPKADVAGVTVSGDTQTRFGVHLGGGYVLSRELPIHVGAEFALFNLFGREDGEAVMLGIQFLAGYEVRF